MEKLNYIINHWNDNCLGGSKVRRAETPTSENTVIIKGVPLDTNDDDIISDAGCESVYRFISKHGYPTRAVKLNFATNDEVHIALRLGVKLPSRYNILLRAVEIK